MRYLVVTAPDFHGLDLGALWEDVKAEGSVGLKHHASWERFAVVTDKDWMRNAIAAFGWVSPGRAACVRAGPTRAREGLARRGVLIRASAT